MSIHEKRAELLSFYDKLLQSLNVKSDPAGRLSLVVPTSSGGEIVSECMSGDKRVTLPIDEILRTGEWEGLIGFHPLSENTLHGESEMIHFLRKLIHFNISGTAGALMEDLVKTAADQDSHAGMTPTQCEFLKSAPNADAKMVKYFKTVLGNHLEQIVSIYLKRNDEIDGEEFRRVASAAFPMYHEMSTEGTKIYKTNVGSKERKAELAAVFEYVFPDPMNVDEWSFGSDGDVAPYFHAIMGIYVKIAKRLNKLIKRHASHLSEATKQMQIDLKWTKGLDNLVAWRDAIPPLPGNKGASVSDKDVASAAESRMASMVGKVATQATKEPKEEDVPPWVSSEPTPARAEERPTDSGGSITWQEMEARRWAQTNVVQSYQQPPPMAGPAPALSYAEVQGGGYGGGYVPGQHTPQYGTPAPAIPYGQPAYPQQQYGAPAQQTGGRPYFHNSV